MEIPNLGKQCNHLTCKQLNFLPIQCNKCLLYFCENHNLPQYHNCQQEMSNVSHDNEQNIPKSYTCTFEDCKKKELIPFNCGSCSKLLCLKHRHQIDHKCPHYEPPSNPMAEAAEKIEKLSTALGNRQTESAKPKKRNKKNEQLAAKVQLMKLKQKAKGQSSIPITERVVFNISTPKSCKHIISLPLFVHERWSIGKAVDAITEELKISNRNNESAANHLCLFHPGDGSVVGQPSDIIKDLVQKEIILNGQTLILEYVSPGCLHLAGFQDYSI